MASLMADPEMRRMAESFGGMMGGAPGGGGAGGRGGNSGNGNDNMYS